MANFSAGLQKTISEATLQSIVLLKEPLQKTLVNTSLTITILAGAALGILIANLIEKIFPDSYHILHIVFILAGSFCGLVTGVALTNILGLGNLIAV